MRIAYDYGNGVNIPGLRPATGASRSPRTQVMVIHVGEGARQYSRENPLEGSPGSTVSSEAAQGDAGAWNSGIPAGRGNAEPRSTPSREGIPVPGTDYLLGVSDEAVRRDREVRAHEKAHLTVLGAYAASGIYYQSRRGPDGQSYATGGRIKADLEPVPGDPRATLQKAKTVLRAAYAPGNPSAADMRVAADAYRLAAEAKEELLGAELQTGLLA